MRLKNIYRTLKEVESVIIELEPESISQSNDFNIKNWDKMLEAIEKIKNIEVFKSVGQDIFKISPIFGEKNQTLRITNKLVQAFINWLEEIKTKVVVTIELCESLGYGENQGSFEVKLPETKDLEEFASNINNLNKSIQLCPFIKVDDNDIRLTKTDIGSTWLEFAFTGAKVITALTALGYFAQSALKIKSMYLTCEQQKEAVRGAQTKNDLAEEITNVYKNMIKATSANEVKDLEEKTGMPLEPEERNSAEKSLEMLGKLMSKGLEIYATLDSPEEAKDVFPNMQEQNLISGILKTLPEKKQDN